MRQCVARGQLARARQRADAARRRAGFNTKLAQYRWPFTHRAGERACVEDAFFTSAALNAWALHEEYRKQSSLPSERFPDFAVNLARALVACAPGFARGDFHFHE